MKLKKAVIIMISILHLCGCSNIVEHSYFKFNVENVESLASYEYLTSEDLTYMRINDIAFVPEIKETGHNKYVIYVCAYSKDGTDTVMVKNARICDNTGRTLYVGENVDETVKFDSTDQALRYGYVVAGEFSATDISICDGMYISLVVQVQVSNDTQSITDEITYNITVTGYETFVART